MYDPLCTRELWGAVLTQAIKDLGATAPGEPFPRASGERGYNQRQAHLFFEGKSAWFCWVCTAAGLDPDLVHAAYLNGTLNGAMHRLQLHYRHPGMKTPEDVE